MADTPGTFENRAFRMTAAVADLRVTRAEVDEGLSRLTTMRVGFVSRDRALDLSRILGRPLGLEADGPDGTTRHFSGLVIAAEHIGAYGAYAHYVADVACWLWFLGRRTNCRVFQEMSSVDIAQAILGDYGFSGDLALRLSGNPDRREYCVQYRESDLDFLNRLFEEDGLYYFFEHAAGSATMVLANGAGAHQPVPGAAKIAYFESEPGFRRDRSHIFALTADERALSGKVSLMDFDFEKPATILEAARAIRSGTHGHAEYELYDTPGHHRTVGEGETRARVRMEAEAARFRQVYGTGNVRHLAAGRHFTLTQNPVPARGSDFLVTRTIHRLQVEPEVCEDAGFLDRSLRFDAPQVDMCEVDFVAVPKDTPWRAPRVTPWPAIAGIQTATVTGPSGEEIHTDKYGRVKVQFHWDREGKRDANSSMWVRVATPWSGRGWGAVAIPRIGQEVVVQFEEGDPDRPLVTGMVYNDATMPPWTLPANKTQSGVRTNSSKGGEGFNELMFEDKKGEELVRFQAERDYTQIVKNDATITVGLEKKEKGDMALTVQRNLTETVRTGDHRFTVGQGNQTIGIKKDKTETIEGKSTLTVTGDVTETVKQGNVTTTLNMGNEAHTLKMGNLTVDTKLGSMTFTAMQKIELKVGSSSIEITQMGVTIKGIMVKVEGTAMLSAKAPMTDVKGDVLLILKGGMTMIN
jgi:type VI secretion system secreted protein VgrG